MRKEWFPIGSYDKQTQTKMAPCEMLKKIMSFQVGSKQIDQKVEIRRIS